MIKFFRRIRQKLLTENKASPSTGRFGRYLIYAIGETLLVVIGILIALQVNTWNNEKAESVKERKILTEMVRNLTMNVNHFSLEIEKQDSIIRNIDTFIDQIKKETPYHDSLGAKYASICWTEEFNFANSAFQTLQTIGLDLISSDSLRENIINLFNITYLRNSNVVNKISTVDYTGLINVYNRHIEFDKQGNAKINDFDSLVKDREFMNILSGRRVWKTDLINMYKELVEASTQLKNMIERELTKKN